MIQVLLGAMIADADRVAQARANKEPVLREMCQRAGLAYPPKAIFLRVFKKERVLEVWGGAKAGGAMRLLQTYPIAAMSGGPGPKRKEGDRQVPEGCYVIDRFNPQSSYHLSLRVSYPNASDRVFADKAAPGGDIYIHGNQVSIGCLAMTDDKIEEIYVLAWNVRRTTIPVHIFPAKRYDHQIKSNPSEDTRNLWSDLIPIQHAFDKSRVVPKVKIGKDGRHRLQEPRTK
ncbi:MAG: L,D-transpeptidase family protein [Fimbriimonadaceae bacterium]|nr:L,D-transpeptidase family protein [Fimbriimonadaceae bacterium]